MRQDPSGKDGRLSGGDSHPAAPLLQPAQQRGNTGIDGIFEQSHCGKPLPVQRYQPLCLGLVTVQMLLERELQRRSDPGIIGLHGRCGVAALFQRVTHAAADALSGIGEGPVQIKENERIPHYRSSRK